MTEKENLSTEVDVVEATDAADAQAEETNVPEFNWGDGLELEVSSEQMSATMSLALNQSENYTSEDLLRYLEENNVVSGVLDDEVRRIHEERLFNQKVKVAKGRQAKNGEDGYIDWQIDLSVLEGAELAEKGGRVDHKERHHVIEVVEDLLLARLVDPTDGDAGETITGKELAPTPGKPAKLPSGKNVRVSDDGKEMCAAIKGVVCKDGEKYSVSPVYTVQGDVSYETGNVRFEETVMVSGGVLPDFKIEAGQDIHVTGLVESSFLTAEGSIYCTAGIQGGEKAVLKAKGDVTAKFVNATTIEAGGDITIDGAVTQSHLKAGGKITLSGDKGVVLGGELEAVKEINVHTAGSELGVKTRFLVGGPVGEFITQKQDEEKKVAGLKENLKRIQLALVQLNKLRDAGKINEQQNALRMKITRAGLQLQGQIKKKTEEIEVIEKAVEKAKHDIVGVIAREKAWPGVFVNILGHQFTVKNETSKPHFALKGAVVEVFGYNPEDSKKKKDKKKDGKEEVEAKKEAE
ncbi:MAG: FapA family protein [Candidatus Hinthialibacter antarcticus]|nr:FapA family protein [Candidatus Hinthialibacter antarcticus]